MYYWCFYLHLQGLQKNTNSAPFFNYSGLRVMISQARPCPVRSMIRQSKMASTWMGAQPAERDQLGERPGSRTKAIQQDHQPAAACKKAGLRHRAQAGSRQVVKIIPARPRLRRKLSIFI